MIVLVRDKDQVLQEHLCPTVLISAALNKDQQFQGHFLPIVQITPAWDLVHLLQELLYQILPTSTAQVMLRTLTVMPNFFVNYDFYNIDCYFIYEQE